MWQYKVYGVPLIGSQPLSAEDVQMYEILKERLDIDFTIEDAKMLFQLAKRRKIRRKGTVLIRQGEEATHLGLIYEGEAVAVQVLHVTWISCYVSKEQQHCW